MKLIKFFIAVLICGCTMQATAKSVVVSGTIQNAETPKLVYIYSHFGSKISKFDSAAVSKNAFKFTFKKPVPRGLYLLVVEPKMVVPVVLGAESFNITLDYNKPGQAAFKNSPENDAYTTFKSFESGINNKLQDVKQQADRVSANQDMPPMLMQAEYNKLRTRFDSLLLVLNDYNKSFSSAHAQLFAGKVAAMFASEPKATKDNFFKPTEFTDEELLRGDMLQEKITIYLQKFMNQDLEAWKEGAEDILAKAAAKSPTQEVIYMALVNIFKQIDPDYTRTLAKAHKQTFGDNAISKEMMASLPPAAPEVGDLAPDIKLAGSDGKERSLSSLKGSVVLLDFWASWCGPCRIENPNVVKVYNQYKQKGFDIFSVSLDNDRDRWLRAIEQDKLSWENHVSDLQGWRSAGAVKYRVNSIPATYLIDKEGRIIAKNLRGAALEAKLKQLID